LDSASAGDSRSAYDAVDEDLWAELRTLLDWHERFTLVLLYSGAPAALAAIRQRLADVLRLKSLNLVAVEPQSSATVVEDVMTAVATSDAPGGSRRPLWVDVCRDPTSEHWNAGRDALLQRLNEQRSRLERDVPTLFVLTLPPDYVARVPGLAPDL
jgi:hypothetical protein